MATMDLKECGPHVYHKAMFVIRIRVLKGTVAPDLIGLKVVWLDRL